MNLASNIVVVRMLSELLLREDGGSTCRWGKKRLREEGKYQQCFELRVPLSPCLIMCCQMSSQ